MKKVIVRIKGGLGNQLFCYTAARRLALVNDAELVIDDTSGFVRDVKYQRKYALDKFHIPVSKATPAERLEPFSRYRRGLKRWISHSQNFLKRSYIEQEKIDFDDRLLAVKIKGEIYLDGAWQSEKYFKDVEHVIREDLKIIAPQDLENKRLSEKINACNAIALHVRWFNNPNIDESHNLYARYYENAIDLIEKKIDLPQYFLFSDNPEAASKKITLPQNRVTFVNNNKGDKNAYADLWLMSQCQHFIIANSTFSWWGAWLSGYEQKIVITPDIKLDGITAWGFDGLIPEEWLIV
jgi:hypothetical protein